MSDISTQDRFAGCLMGVAIGDMLGLPHEGANMRDYSDEELADQSLTAWERMMYTYIHSLYEQGDGKVRDLPDLPESFWRKGEYSDDTSETIAVVEGILDAGKFDMDAITDRLIEWYDSGNARGLGGTTWLSLSLIKDGSATWRDAGAIAKTKGVIERPPWRLEAVPSNGSLMRTAPVGLYYCLDLAANLNAPTVEAASNLSCITHAFGDCEEACWALSELIAELAAGTSKHDALLKIHFMFAGIVEDALMRIRFDKGHPGGVMETLGVALDAFENTNTFEDAVIAAINPGGWLTDTDTYGSVAGALAGAYYGVEAIPQRWQEALNPETGLTARQIQFKADQLFDIVQRNDIEARA